LHIPMLYKRNYLSCHEKLGKVSVNMETNRNMMVKERTGKTELPIVEDTVQSCDFKGYDADTLMKETARLRRRSQRRVHLKS
jgi:hypothetical protein